MEWISDLLLGLAAPAAGVLGAWFGGRGVVQQARVNAEAEREAERERHERERRDAEERELRGRAEALILAVAAVRNMPPDYLNPPGERDDATKREVVSHVYPAVVALGSMHHTLWNVAADVASQAHAGMGDFGSDEYFEGPVDRLLEAVESIVREER